MRFRSICVGVLVMATMAAQGCGMDGHVVVSPDGRNALAVSQSDGGVAYSVRRGGVEVVTPTPISITIDGKSLPGNARVVDVQKRSVDELVRPVVPTVASELRDRFAETRLVFDCDLALCVRAYDDGVAFRWEATGDKAEIIVDAEEFGARFAKDYSVYFPVPQGKDFFSHQENMFEYGPISKTAERVDGPVPGLFDLGGGDYLLLSDVNVEGYPGMWMKGGDKQALATVFPQYPDKVELTSDRDAEVVERRPYLAKTVGDRSFPWRAFVLADAKGLLTSTMLYLLAEPGRLEDCSWIRPGKVAWDWWNAWNIYGVPFKAGINQDTYKYYIDFASEMGIEYIILDEGWSVPGPENLLKVVPEIDMPKLIAYGSEKKVGIVLWMTSAALEANFDKAFAQFDDWGVAGLKIDFMQRDDQVMMDFLYRAAAEAAKRKMIVDYHGGSKPAGINRTWPNVLTIESVKGLEQSKWCDHANPEMAVLLPFTRMVVGPMDYTPGAMVNLQERDFKPIFHRPASMGTRAHQLAMYVVYLSPLQMLADTPSHYRDNPECLPFLRAVPTTWDETRVIEAGVGEFVAVARRHGNRWYVGAMTDWTERELTIGLGFLGSGKYEMVSWVDGPNADKYGDDVVVKSNEAVDSSSKLKVKMAPGGGFAAIIQPSDKTAQ